MGSLQASLESMKTSAQSLQEELGTDLLSQLSVDDQMEVDRLNDEITTINANSKKVLKDRVKVCKKPKERLKGIVLMDSLNVIR